MKKIFTLILLSLLAITTMQAQRKTDPLDRGLVAVKTSDGVFVSWRIQADEYYGVTYNLYRNGTKIAENLEVSNYKDAGATASNTYTVAAVVNGVEKGVSESASVWTSKDGSDNPYLRIQMQDVFDRKGNRVFCCCGQHKVDVSVAQTYVLNDASVADLDGDGEMEIIIKRQNYSDEIGTDPYSFNNEFFSISNDRAYAIIEAYKLNGTRLWWIDCGPNMASMNSVEINAIAYDWDEDGKAEVVLRGADNMIIHKADGSVYNVGNMSVNTRNDLVSHASAQYAWTRTGAEYLLYLNGSTANPYQIIDYPLPRYEADEIGKTEREVWSPTNSNGGYGHRSSKYFFGAPVLDGRHASIFLARGIYTQTKMCALDVNPSSHQLSTRWTWRCKDTTSPWFGQGNHNFSIADVDGDGCDEIIYGSMVIDNNGRGLSTTGLGHGDALHVGDLDPFRKGLEVFACNEEEPSNNFRNATTSEIYLREPSHGVDDGRCMAGNFTNDYPGSIGASTQSGIAALSMIQTNPYSPVYIDGWANNWTTNTPNPALNWRIYWDGDLLEESMNGPGSNEGELFVAKNGNRIMMTNGAKCNNDTKKNPSFTGDIIGDWREEIVMRSNDNKELRIYTTTIPTTNRIPCLWYDHEYRQAMVWQMCGYNQPPHVSFFMGEMEGLTKVPVPNTMKGRHEITSENEEISTSLNGQDVIAYNKTNIKIANSGASPRTLIIDVPSTVSGSDNNNSISYDYASSNLGNGNLTGAMNMVKQGDGLLNIPQSTYEYTGNTDVFAGSVNMQGTLTNSPVWMNRHTTLYTSGTFGESVTMEYGSTLYVGGANKNDGSAPEYTDYGTATIKTLELHEGARVVLDINKDENKYDALNLTILSIRDRSTWQYGPKYLAPVFQFNSPSALPIGNYKIGKANSSEGLDKIIIEGSFASGTKQRIANVGGTLYLKVYDGDEETPVLPEASISMTHVNYDEPNTSYGEQTTATAGYNKISDGKVDFGNKNWAKNWITYLKVDLSEYKEHNVSEVTLSFDASGSTDNQRGTSWGIGYNNSEWQPTMTYNTADKSITVIGGTQSNPSKSSTSFVNLSWDITDVYDADKDGIITILVYETAAAGGYVKNPTVDVKYTYIEPEEEPTNVVTITKEYDFKNWSTQYLKLGTTEAGTAWETGNSRYQKLYNCTEPSILNGAFAFQTVKVESDANSKGYKVVNGTGLYMDGNGSRSGAVLNMKEGTVIKFYVDNPSTYPIDFKGGGNGDGTWEVTSTSYGYEIRMITDGNLGFCIPKYGAIAKITIDEPATLTLTRSYLDTYQPGIYGIVNVNRSFSAGYSTLCVPFNADVADFTNNDDEAYVAYLSGIEEADGTTTIIFKNSDKIEANMPCIIFLSKDLSNPSLKNVAVFEENAKTITKQGWSMTGNYQEKMSMAGLYGVARNSNIMRGGASSTLSGLAAYLTGPANASAKARFSDDFDDVTPVVGIDSDEATITGIYTLNGCRTDRLQRGVNIIRMSNGKTRKVIVR